MGISYSSCHSNHLHFINIYNTNDAKIVHKAKPTELEQMKTEITGLFKQRITEAKGEIKDFRKIT